MVTLLAASGVSDAFGQALRDGFNDANGVVGGACCTDDAMPVLPLPAGVIELPSVYACLLDCGMDEKWVGCTLFQAFPGADVTQTPAAPCDEAIFKLTNLLQQESTMIDPCAPDAMTFVFSIDLRGKYVETWLMDDDQSPDTRRQVWRWLVHGNAQFSPTFLSMTPCPTPEGVTYPTTQDRPFDQPPFSGHVDLSLLTDTKTETAIRWEVALVISHGSGCFVHNGNILLNALGLDPLTDPAGAAVRAVADRRHYHLVAPRAECPPYFGFAASPFPSQSSIAMTAPTGVIGTFRSTGSNAFPECNFESDAIFDSVPYQTPECHCGQGMMMPGLYYHETIASAGNLNGVYCDMGSGNTLFPWQSASTGMGGGNLPTGFTQLYVGAWLEDTIAYCDRSRPIATWLEGTEVFQCGGVLDFTTPCFSNPNVSWPTYQLVNGVTTRARNQNTATFVDVPTSAHPSTATLLLQMQNSLSRNFIPFTSPLTSIPQDHPHLGGALPTLPTMTFGGATLTLPATAATTVWSFGR